MSVRKGSADGKHCLPPSHQSRKLKKVFFFVSSRKAEGFPRSCAAEPPKGKACSDPTLLAYDRV